MGIVTGTVEPGDGRAPAVALINPKYPHNVGAAVRAASCYGVSQLWFTGTRVELVGERRHRLPREERMRGYQDVELRHSDQVFGPEDGSLDRAVLGLCHRFVVIPTRHCTNLAAAVYTVLYDRHAKRVRAGVEPLNTLVERRGFDEPDHLAGAVGVQ